MIALQWVFTLLQYLHPLGPFVVSAVSSDRMNWMKMLLAILLGNVIYVLIAPHLPNALAHDIFQLDAGLLFDFGICAGLYFLIRKVA